MLSPSQPSELHVEQPPKYTLQGVTGKVNIIVYSFPSLTVNKIDLGSFKHPTDFSQH